MFDWLVVKAVLGLKAVLLAGVSVLTSADWSPSSPDRVRAFLVNGDDSPITVVVSKSKDHGDAVKVRTVRIVRLGDVSQVLEAQSSADDGEAETCTARWSCTI